MRRLVRSLAEAVVCGAGAYLGLRVGQSLSDPYSDARLRTSGIVERLRKVVTR